MRAVSQVLVQMHELALGREWNGARAVIALHLLFETDYILFAANPKWPRRIGSAYNMTHGNYHLPLLLTQALSLHHDVVTVKSQVCSNNLCLLHAKLEKELRWSTQVESRRAGRTFPETIMAQLFPAEIENACRQPSCPGRLTTSCYVKRLPTLLMLRLNDSSSNRASRWSPADIPNSLDLSHRNNDSDVPAIYDLYNLWLYDSSHFVTYFCFNRAGSSPLYVYNDCMSSQRTSPAIYSSETSELQLPNEYFVNGAWYVLRQ